MSVCGSHLQEETGKLEILKSWDAVIVRLKDGTLKKFVASLEFGHEVSIEEEDLTYHDLRQMGDITEEEWYRRATKHKSERTVASLDDQLLVAWRNYYDHGIKDGFPKPVKYPSFVQEAVDKIEWGKADQKIISRNGVSFILERP